MRPMKFSLDPRMCDKLAAQAITHGISMGQEIKNRLEQSFTREMTTNPRGSGER